jgi:hypothetical protein
MVEVGANSANITPATELVVANTLGESPSIAFSNYSITQQTKITEANITAAVARIQIATASLGSDADMAGIDIMKGYLQAATTDGPGNAADAKIDALMAALSSADKKISDLSNLLSTTRNVADTAAQLTTLVGSSQYSLASCPAARSGDFWVLDLLGTAPMGFNADFNKMTLTNLRDNSTSAINFLRSTDNAVVPCAFTATPRALGTSNVEFRITDGGIGVWRNASNFGITVPAQRTKTLTDIAFAGTYPTAGFLREVNQGTRAALPFRFKINTDGSLQAYSCDLTKALPDCTTTLDTGNSTATVCTPMSNGTLSCSAPNGFRATAVLYVTGGQVSMFMAVTQMPYNNYNFGGLIAMTKASPMKVPSVGQTTASGRAWFAGVASNTNTVISGDTNSARVESVNTSANAYVTSSAGTTTTYTRYINTPSEGLGLSNASNGGTAISIGSNTGWSMTMSKNSGSTAYDGWYVYARAKK